ncbi:L-serine ammonia-lyase [Allorhodopirellula heiligendammensis]|uniref:L-serine dehydratase n=1 Tax=Allorhodopirellula heiligendammensis TaxID=2714739 RepID=A0A5C6BTS5_9BACT|nr:L-serine ammonia-lyase [Allorhodopirellula heiligendammensis]TWU15428.1 L-serine dehydratase 1 [Allorhodopirellula heiligendammensis]
MSSELPYYSVFDLFKIGIGPSSSHSVGPMRAAEMFLHELSERHLIASVQRVRVDLYGSLALTGLGHATDIAVLMGLQGEVPDQIDPELTAEKIQSIRQDKKLQLAGNQQIVFDENTDLVFNRRTTLDTHSNGMRFQAFETCDAVSPVYEATYFSIGGGFVIPAQITDDETTGIRSPASPEVPVPYPFSSARELLELTQQHGISISDLALANERALRSDEEIREGLDRIWKTMRDCVERGCRVEGILPGGLKIRRRAPGLFRKLSEQSDSEMRDPMTVLDWVDLYALAVNEENAAGGRVVTAPTNGAAGIVPALLHYLDRFCDSVTPDTIRRFLLTAAVIGSLYKRNASISGAEVGCQGEVGVACSMAAGALTEALGGTPRQVEQAAEIGMEHNLGLTCDPIKGLVQVPCIERNAMGAVKAINASRLALRGDGEHFVSLDRVIRVMKRTGADMSSRYKETSRGGLAVNISEC